MDVHNRAIEAQGSKDAHSSTTDRNTTRPQHVGGVWMITIPLAMLLAIGSSFAGMELQMARGQGWPEPPPVASEGAATRIADALELCTLVGVPILVLSVAFILALGVYAKLRNRSIGLWIWPSLLVISAALTPIAASTPLR